MLAIDSGGAMKRFLLGLAIAAALLLALEGVLWLAGFQGDPALGDYRLRVAGELHGVPDPVRFWRLPNVEPHFTDDGARIICLADSVTVMEQGRGWPDRLGPALEKAGYEQSVQVFNAGVPEYTSWQGMQYLRHELLAQKPDLVTIQFGWNDHWPSQTGEPDHEVRMPSARMLTVQQTLAYSRTYRLLRRWIRPVRSESGRLRVPLQQYKNNLREMIALTRQAGGKVMLITAPYLEGPWGWRNLHRQYNMATRAVAEAEQAALLDVVPLFLRSPNLFFEPEVDQCHFNGDGAEIIAALAAQTIVDKGLLQ